MSNTERADLSSCNVAACLFHFLGLFQTSNRVYAEMQRVKCLKGLWWV